MIAQVVRDTGWGWEQALDEITAPRLEALQRSWKRAPPLHVIVAAWAGHKPPTEPGNQITTADEARRHFAMTGGRIPGM